MPFEQIVEEHHVIQFKDASELAYQEVGSILRPYVSEQECEGEQSRVMRLFDPTTATRRTSRVPENLDNRTNRRSRWLIYQDPLEDGEYIDEMDLWRQAFNPQSELLKAKNASVGRGIDQDILSGMRGNAFEGKRGEKSKVLPAAQILAVDVETPGTDVGMTVFKLRKAREKLAEGFALDGNEPYAGITARQHDDLLSFLEVTSTDFNQMERPVLREGKLKRFMGFDLVEMQGYQTKAGDATIRECPAWIKSAVCLGVWSDVRSRMWNDTHRNMTPYINIDFVGDARRKQDPGVVIIECKEA